MGKFFQTKMDNIRMDLLNLEFGWYVGEAELHSLLETVLFGVFLPARQSVEMHYAGW